VCYNSQNQEGLFKKGVLKNEEEFKNAYKHRGQETSWFPQQNGH